MDFVDMDDSDRVAVVGTRWRKVAALGDTRNVLLVRAIELAPKSAAAAHQPEPTALFVSDVEHDERIAVVAHGATTLSARLDGEVGAQMFAGIHGEDGSFRTIQGAGEVSVQVPVGTKRLV